ncbi:hypothetical protein P153DRAFT_401790 [Dothidotthia symphoricarpi CBS 119687]|uniref:Uncharacterized protein n=1 Tax=Dothidotthia symphoricarpi CBS 119687 TaxID=1392245 RepID=A0A6A5ZXJ0_9PLEO|nr:uncharacterized protein P153DRAFT_401790 [Dothidotthia symphoricarpi CBS 119687]KAF2123623.1 hypothetical protein P153DRAFT_401790 [Dothidotthia symphoricarpi CBS 119687]
MPIGRRPSLVAREDDGLQYFDRLTETEDAAELLSRFEKYHPLPPTTQASGFTTTHAEKYILTARALGIHKLLDGDGDGDDDNDDDVTEPRRRALERRFHVGVTAVASFHLTVRNIERISDEWGTDAWFRLRDAGVVLPVLAPPKRVYEKLATIAQHLTLGQFAQRFQDAWPQLIRGRRLEGQPERAVQYEDLRLFYEEHIVPGLYHTPESSADTPSRDDEPPPGEASPRAVEVARGAPVDARLEEPRVSHSPAPSFARSPTPPPTPTPTAPRQTDLDDISITGFDVDDTGTIHGDTGVAGAEQDIAMVSTRGASATGAQQPKAAHTTQDAAKDAAKGPVEDAAKDPTPPPKEQAPLKDVSIDTLRKTMSGRFPTMLSLFDHSSHAEATARQALHRAAQGAADAHQAFVQTKQDIVHQLPPNGPWRNKHGFTVTSTTLTAGKQELDEEVALVEALQAVSSKHSAAARRLGTDHSNLLAKKRKANEDVGEAIVLLGDAEEVRKGAKRVRAEARRELVEIEGAVDATMAFAVRWYAGIAKAREEDDGGGGERGESSADEEDEDTNELGNGDGE